MDLVDVARKSVGVGAEIDAELEEKCVEFGVIFAVEGVRFPSSGELFRIPASIGDQVIE